MDYYDKITVYDLEDNVSQQEFRRYRYTVHNNLEDSVSQFTPIQKLRYRFKVHAN